VALIVLLIQACFKLNDLCSFGCFFNSRTLQHKRLLQIHHFCSYETEER